LTECTDFARQGFRATWRDRTGELRAVLNMGDKLMNKSIREVIGIASVGTAITLAALCGASNAWAQQKASAAQKQIVGVWRLVSAVNIGTDGVARPGSFGPNPNGKIIFTSSGHYATVNTHPDLPKFASGNRMQGTTEENRAIVHGSNSTFGTYSVSDDGKVLTLKIEGGTWPHWTGTEQKRDLTLAGDDMSYSLTSSRGGRATLVWKRVN
jgi:hypothetical protein